MPKPLNRQLKQLIPWAAPMLLILFWQLLSQTGILPARILPAPTAVVQAGLNLASTGELWRNLYVSTIRAFIGFVIGGLLGFVLGLVNGLFPVVDRLLDTSLQMLRNIPHLSLIPLVILWFGIGEEAKFFLVAIGVLFPIYLNTYHGVNTVDRGLIEMGKIYGLKPLDLFWQIIIGLTQREEGKPFKFGIKR